MRYFKIILSLIINFTNSLQFFVGFLEMGEHFPEQCFSFPQGLGIPVVRYVLAHIPPSPFHCVEPGTVRGAGRKIQACCAL